MEDKTKTEYADAGMPKSTLLAIAISTLVLLAAGGVWWGTRSATKKTFVPKDVVVPEGKESYCEARLGVCWKYPSDWTMEAGDDDAPAVDTGTQKEIEIKDNNSKLVFTYTAPVVVDDGKTDFVPYYVTDVTGTSDLKIVAGVYPAQTNTPMSFVVDAADAAKLVSGEMVSFAATPTFTRKGTTTKLQAKVVAEGTEYATAEAAKVWFDSDELGRSLTILQSISFQNQ
jgi:hypothetical protein